MLSMSWIDLTILILASFRLTHLIVYDEIMSFLRHPFFEVQSIENGNGELVHTAQPKGTGVRRFIGSLLSCHWCVGIWAAVAVVSLYMLVPQSQYVFLILAIAGAAAIIENKV